MVLFLQLPLSSCVVTKACYIIDPCYPLSHIFLYGPNAIEVDNVLKELATDENKQELTWWRSD